MFFKKDKLLSLLKSGFKKTNQSIQNQLKQLILGNPTITDSLKEELVTTLIQADVSFDLANAIIDQAITQTNRSNLNSSAALIEEMKIIILEILSRSHISTNVMEDWINQSIETPNQPQILLFVGVNGVGKTTTLGKIGHLLKSKQQSLLFAAGDTYRSAAIEQIQAWAKRNNSPCIAQQQGADSASVLFDAIESGISQKSNFILADTAGRLHDQTGLMKELGKIHKIIQKFQIPNEVLLILDGTMGQNIIHQVTEFKALIPISGLILTKLDSSAKGGILITLASKFEIPIYALGLGEQPDNLIPFHPNFIIDTLFSIE